MKSLAALNATTRDLAEFVSVVQGDTTSAVSDAASKVKQIMNKVCRMPRPLLFIYNLLLLLWQEQDSEERDETDHPTDGKIPLL